VKQAWIKKFAVKEVPIVFSNRKQGKSKLTKGEFKGFLYYVIKSKFGVAMATEDENGATDAFPNAPNMDEEIQRLIDLYRRVRFF